VFERLAASLSPARLLNALAATAPVTLEAGRAYGPSHRHRLDLYRPRADGPHPLAVFFYGGAWEEGERDTYRFVGAALAAAGIVTVIPDYRVYPEVPQATTASIPKSAFRALSRMVPRQSPGPIGTPQPSAPIRPGWC
jgi:acetyl esterase/lipase